ncbi:hypothetical protein [Burkholderia sp. Ac-20365]|uniref:hypothetical protein n=1 Tax=Burkholderia sp. Ac-20365 TaxID=2703897 RepID=UPI00197C0D97|nr:hypothetical protein [Burkholderia sp. Ac-20365]MBN3760723.1 hypothetical protein [Burkholderia sp. Ac-20365]
MADLDWDFGAAQQTVSLALTATSQAESADELFTVTNYKLGCVIRVIRPRDHVDLLFHIRGLTCTGLSTSRRPHLSRIGGVPRRKLRVIFPPQHVAEGIKQKPLATGSCEEATDWGPMPVRMAQPSRLVFAIPDQINWLPELRLSDLTDWTPLQPIVHRRAGIGPEIADQLAAAFPGMTVPDLKNLSLNDAQAAIAAGLEGPANGETAIEMPSRLILSPSGAGKWVVPKDFPDAGAAPIWTARLDRTGRRSVRAVWSTRLEPHVFPADLDEPPVAAVPMLSLSRRHHWEIVAQTSVYGLPGLRRLVADPAASEDLVTNSAAVPRPTVVRPDIPIGFLTAIDSCHGYVNRDSGIALATPFEDGDLIASALGGFANFTWKGDPPSLFWDAKGDPIGLNLERLTYRGYLGRDTQVVAVEKAYLFPHGIRASLITVVERAIYPDYAQNPISYLIKRHFIVTPKKPRSYPGPYQPFDGREFPPRRVELKTLVTPDLAPILDIQLTLPSDAKPIPQGAIFWPQAIEGNTLSDILFEWSTEDAASVRSKFIFVRNDVISRQDVMRALVDFYNAQDDDRRSAWLGGARHRYAKPKREGDTSFDTTRWILAAQGRRDGPDGGEHFARDGRMEGADQPAFYPLMERGFVAMQNIEQMLGLPHGQVEVRYFDGYKREGIDTAHQIFLTLGQSALPMRSSARADRSGGVASADLNVAAVSRLTGPVGGSTKHALASSPPDFGLAVAGEFDPGQFFGNDAKLLGVVHLADIVRGATAILSLDQAPRLLDETMLGARTEFVLVQSVARGLREALYVDPDLIGRLEAGIAKADTLLVKSKLHLQDVYPSLMQAIAPFRGKPSAVRERLDEAISANTAEEIRPPVDALAPLLRNILDAVADVIKDPVPDVFEEVIGAVRQSFELLVGKADREINDKATAAWSLILKWVRDAFCAAIDDANFGTVLFGARGMLSCTEIFKDPVAALRGLKEGLYGAAFDQAWQSLLEILDREADLGARLDLALEDRRATIASALRAGVSLVADRLQPYDPRVDDIRTAQIQQAFLDGLAGDFAKIVTPSSGTMSPDEALTFVTGVLDTFPAEATMALKGRVASLLPTVHAIATEDASALLEELSIFVGNRLKRVVFAPLMDEANALAARLKALLENAASAAFSHAIAIVVNLFDAVLGCSEIAAIAKAGRRLQGVCDSVSAAAKLIGDGVLAASADLDAAAHAIKTAAGQIQVPPNPIGLPLRAALAAINAATEDVLEAITRLDAQRHRLAQAGDTACALTHDYLDPLAAIVRLRRSTTDSLVEIARGCEVIEAHLLHGNPVPAVQTSFDEIVKQCAALSRGLTGIDALAGPQPLLDAAIAQIKAAAISPKDYLDRLDAAARTVALDAAALRAELSGAIETDRLRALLDGEVKTFQEALDRRLAAFLMQSVGFTSDTLTAMDKAIENVLAPFMAALIPIYSLAETVFARILDTDLHNETLNKVYRLALGGDEKIDTLAAARQDVALEKGEVQAIANNPDVTTVSALIDRYRRHQGALNKAVAAVEALGLTDVGQTLTEALRHELERIEEEVRALVLQLVPTKLQTRYFWPTALKRFPDSENGWIFKPTDDAPPGKRPSDPPIGHPAAKAGFNWHLWIDGRFSFDVVTGKREVDINGVLRPFELRLLGADFCMLTISFEETRFTSVNGATPDFAVQVKDVKIGTYLKFVENLQQWLTPQGSGFYLCAAQEFPGIEVGYVYDAGIIQIGSLQFINVAFRISAILPFSADSVSKGRALFRFALASRDRPFLISSPPYGGGGWIRITCSTDGIESIDLAFVFGGVAAIKFGPLDAQGRIVAGIRVESLTTTDGKKAHLITALFEAVGEGNIACFSTSVSLRVALTQTTGGALFGETTYSFSFKVGFVRLSYSVSARYRLSNGSDPQALNRLSLSATTPTLIRTQVPVKETQWQSYRAFFDLELLEAA